MPNHKIVYIIRLREYVQGIWDTLIAYGVEFNKENHELLVEIVQTKLEGPDIEREWTEEEHNNFVEFTYVSKSANKNN